MNVFTSCGNEFCFSERLVVAMPSRGPMGGGSRDQPRVSGRSCTARQTWFRWFHVSGPPDETTNELKERRCERVSRGSRLVERDGGYQLGIVFNNQVLEELFKGFVMGASFVETLGPLCGRSSK